MLRGTDNSRGPFPGIVLVVLLTGCATEQIPEQALRLEESTLEVRSLQTRKLAAPSETAIGVISASKVSDADDSGEKTGLFFLDLLCAAGGGGGCDNMSTAKDEQRVNLTMVVLPSLERSGEYAVRVTLQRVIFDKEDRVKILETITVPEIYQEVFDNLRQALFIEVGET